MPKNHCFTYNFSNSEAKKKNPDKYPKVSDVTFHCFPPDNEKSTTLLEWTSGRDIEGGLQHVDWKAKPERYKAYSDLL